jgi:predicted dehydrogenase
MPSHDISRRQFLEASVAAGTLAMMGAAPTTQTGKLVRVGVVGIGDRGLSLIHTLLAIEGVTINAVCDVVEEHATAGRKVIEKKTGRRVDSYSKGERDWENLVARDDLDAVINATPWEWHAPISIATMKSGKYAGVEVPAAITVDDCWELIRVSQQTGKPCMMLENVCYFRDVMAILNMVRGGMFGEVMHCAGGYQHDVRFRWIIDGQETWRGKHSELKNGCLYPTHQAGPIAQWLNVNHGDRFTHLVSFSTKSTGINSYAADKVGADSELAKKTWSLGDINTTLLKTANGKTVTLYHDCSTERPYDLMFRVEGTRGVWMQDMSKIYLKGASPKNETWESDEPYLKKYDDETWRANDDAATKTGGHGGADYMTLRAFLDAVRNGTQTPIDLIDSVTWSAIHPLSCESVAKNAVVEFPDFTSGKWKTSVPSPLSGGGYGGG